VSEGDFPDTEGAVRNYLKAHPSVSAITTRGFFAVPTAPTYPLFTVVQVGGIEDDTEAPVDVCLLQVDEWGEVDAKGFARKADCAALRRAIRRAFFDLRVSTAVTVGTDVVTLDGARIVSDSYLPDLTNRRPRYSQTVEVVARLTPVPTP
jgi:hypothetical protein